jgi:hypothetical protein
MAFFTLNIKGCTNIMTGLILGTADLVVGAIGGDEGGDGELGG